MSTLWDIGTQRVWEMDHLRSASPFLWVALLIMDVTIKYQNISKQNPAPCVLAQLYVKLLLPAYLHREINSSHVTCKPFKDGGCLFFYDDRINTVAKKEVTQLGSCSFTWSRQSLPKRHVIGTYAPPELCVPHAWMHLHIQLHILLYVQCCPPAQSFVAVQWREIVGEQDGIPHILQWYLRTGHPGFPLSLPLSFATIFLYPPWAMI